MSIETIKILFLAFLGGEFLVQSGLILLNLKYGERFRGKVPSFFQSLFSTEEFNRSLDYSKAKANVSLLSNTASSLLLIIFILSGFFGTLDTYLGTLSLPGYWSGIFYLYVVSLVFSIVGMPFGLYQTFVVEEKFGFNKLTFKLWLVDLIKGTAISLILGTVVLNALFWFMDVAGPHWWVWAFVFVATFQLVLMYLFPVVIMPLFNKFSLLEVGPLRAAIEDLATRLQFKTEGIFLMDGSKRSAHANAFFTGFGKHKRIVLFDTLIALLTERQLLAVLAHEIGHQKKHHIKKSLIISMIMMCVGFYFLSILLNYPQFFAAFGFQHPSNYAALVILMFGFSPVGFFIGPLFSALSRKHEYEADRFAVDALAETVPLVDGLKALSKKSLSNLVPHPLYSFFFYSHPTLVERINAMEKLG